jgi:transcription-repair coupling factor (superfamily II helicase)
MISNIIDHMLSQNSPFVITPRDGSSRAWLAARLFETLNRDLLVVIPDPGRADTLINDLHFFLPDKKNQVLFFRGMKCCRSSLCPVTGRPHCAGWRCFPG